jgi:hypothetical protein
MELTSNKDIENKDDKETINSQNSILFIIMHTFIHSKNNIKISFKINFFIK